MARRGWSAGRQPPVIDIIIAFASGLLELSIGYRVHCLDFPNGDK